MTDARLSGGAVSGRTMLGYTVAALAAGVSLWFISRESYLLYHTLVEIFCVVVASAQFTVAWNTRRFSGNGYLTYLGIAWLFVAAFDLIHTITFKGMGIFPGEGANLPTQLWIAARLLEALSLLVAPIFIDRQVRVWSVVVVYAIASTALAVALCSGSFPACYNDAGPQSGLTLFKIAAEYVICLILLLSFGLLARRRERFPSRVYALMMAGIIFTILSEVAFTHYVSVYGVFNFIGHLFKTVVFVLIYRATVVATLQQPYEVLFHDLREREQALQQAKEELARHAQNLERAVAERTGQLQESIRELERFSYSLVHDMRAPLRAMRSFSDILTMQASHKLEPSERELLGRIASASTRLDRLIRDMLCYYRTVREELPLSTVDVEHLVESLLQEQEQFKAPAAEITFRKPLLKVHAHEAALAQCLFNLLDNAVKFVERGQQPKITVWAERHGPNVRLYVQDNGIGIPEEQQKRIFELFQREHHTSEYEGTGLGLSIVRKSVERMGGQAGLDSQPGRGSRFWIELPAAENV